MVCHDRSIPHPRVLQTISIADSTSCADTRETVLLTMLLILLVVGAVVVLVLLVKSEALLVTQLHV